MHTRVPRPRRASLEPGASPGKGAACGSPQLFPLQNLGLYFRSILCYALPAALSVQWNRTPQQPRL